MPTAVRPATRAGPGRSSGAVLVAIDGWLPAADEIVAALTVPACIVRIDPARDGLTQLVTAAQAMPGRPLVVICHGDPGALALANRPVTAATVAGRRDELAALGVALAGAPIELYACSVAEGAAGRSFVAALQRATGCPVAAASGPVGGTALGGSWTLDAGTGDWNTAGNWDPAGVPSGAGDNAIIDNGGTAQITSAAPTAGGVIVGHTNGGSGTLQILSGGSLTANNTTAAIGNFAGSTGTMLVDGTGAFNSGSFAITVGNSGTGTLTVSDGGTVTTTNSLGVRLGFGGA